MMLATSLTTPPLARLNYVLRAPQGGTREAVIDAVGAAAPIEFTGSFDDAVRAARLLAGQARPDGIHRQPVNQAHAVLGVAGQPWRIVPLVGDHRGRIGPVFIDGPFAEKAALAIHAERLADDLQAIVGAAHMLDLRGPRRARLTALAPPLH